MARGTSDKDTIVAVATAPGRGGIGIIRVSGDKVKLVAEKVVGKVPAPRYATLASFTDKDSETIDTGIALYFPAPNSFTGEDVLELQGHGGPVVLDILLNRIVSCGARIANPGEFSERAFLNDKIDLSQAEAIADLIDSVSQQAAKGAINSLKGAFSSRVNTLSEMTVNLRMYIEAAIDFPEEEIDFLADERIAESLRELESALLQTQKEAGQGALLREGINLVIAGRPNAGKSSLMNALTGADSSIVTSIPGTTRDVVREFIHLDGIPLKVTDTAGIRASQDEVEIEGVRRALKETEVADQILIVVDLEAHRDDWREQASELIEELTHELAKPSTRVITIVLNKVDLVGSVPNIEPEVICISAKNGSGIDLLKERIKGVAGFEAGGEGSFLARTRHLDALSRAAAHLSQGKMQLEDRQAGELLAEDLRLCHEALSEITGEFTPDDLLGEIFSRFCIGK